jgi:azobenzene reductase
MKIAILLGSVRTGRQTHKIAYYVEQQLAARNHEVLMLDLGLHPVPLMDERYNRTEQPLPEIIDMGEKLKAAAYSKTHWIITGPSSSTNPWA